ncbi:MAG: hypothetical protein CR986_05840 [Ignavibacteriae bacterium]|nr:MAG: hypothetical protein CR986_05840 [Ignavibacteriota bacterium]
MKKTALILICLFIIFSKNILASGFQINEHGSKAMAMGGAFSGLANDPSALYFNPAGITQLYGTHFLVGSTLIFPSMSFRGPAPSINESTTESRVFFPFHLYASHQVNKELFLGFGLGNNYGLGTKWDEDWVGRFLAVQTEIRTFFFNLAASYQIIPEISVGFGYAFAYGDVLLGRRVNLSPFNNEAYLELEGDGIGSGITAGVLFHVTRAISVGLSYRSQVTIEFEGDATPSKYPTQFEGRLPNGNISAPLTTPENITVGIALKPTKKLNITADFQFVGWDSYDKLEVTFNEFKVPGTEQNYISTSKRDYDNSYIARLGAEYKYSRSLDLYCGLLYDKNPVSDQKLDPTLPDSDRLGLSLGFGYKLTPSLTLQAGYLFLRFDERKISDSKENYGGTPNNIAYLNGVYNSSAHLTSLTLSYNF